MKNSLKLFGIIALIAIIGFVVTSCDNGNGNGACTNHTWGDWQNITKQPNCIETGTGTRTCTNCGTTDTNTTIPTNNDHNFADNWLPTATSDWCVDDGEGNLVCGNGIETLTCTRCTANNGTRISSPCKGTQGLAISSGEVTGRGTATGGIICIPDTATSIASEAFRNDTDLTSVRIGKNVTTIGNNAFRNCSNLTNVIIGNSVTSIGNSAFRDCTDLTSIVIPNSVTSIGNNVFQNTGILNNASDNSVVYIDKWIIGVKGTLSGNIVIPDGIISIGDNLFSSTAITSITIPASVTSIGYQAFSNCTSLATVTFAEGSQLETIGGYVFANCTSLTSITIPVNVTSIGEAAFVACTNLTTVTFAEGSQLETIGGNVFQSCTSLTSITIPAGVTSIQTNAFWGFTSSQEIHIPYSTLNPSGWSSLWRNDCNAKIFHNGVLLNP